MLCLLLLLLQCSLLLQLNALLVLLLCHLLWTLLTGHLREAMLLALLDMLLLRQRLLALRQRVLAWLLLRSRSTGCMDRLD